MKDFVNYFIIVAIIVLVFIIVKIIYNLVFKKPETDIIPEPKPVPYNDPYYPEPDNESDIDTIPGKNNENDIATNPRVGKKSQRPSPEIYWEIRQIDPYSHSVMGKARVNAYRRSFVVGRGSGCSFTVKNAPQHDCSRKHLNLVMDRSGNLYADLLQPEKEHTYTQDGRIIRNRINVHDGLVIKIGSAVLMFKKVQAMNNRNYYD